MNFLNFFDFLFFLDYSGKFKNAQHESSHIWYAAKWGSQVAEMVFETRSNPGNAQDSDFFRSHTVPDPDPAAVMGQNA